MATSYIPFYPWALFFCFLPLWLVWQEERSPKKAFWYGWLAQFTFNIIGFHWIYHTGKEFGHLPIPLAILGLVAFASFASLQLPLSGAVAVWIQRKISLNPYEKLFCYSFLFYIFEQLYPTIFPWSLGYPWLYAHWPAVQWAEFIGIEGLGFLTLLFHIFFYHMITQRQNWRLVSRWAVTFCLIFVSLNMAGLWRAKEFEKEPQHLKVLAIQANIGNLEKAYAEKGAGYQSYILNSYMDLIKEGLLAHPEAEAIVLPETALPITLDPPYQSLYLQEQWFQLAKEIQRPIITGAYSEPGDGLTYNSIFFLEPPFTTSTKYDKSILLAFGEYIPGGDIFPRLYQWLPFVSHFGRGQGPQVISWHHMKVGAQVCYEGLYPKFTQSLSQQGAQWIVNLTNDSWFGNQFEPQQHMIMTLARAIEFRRPLLRVTNTGISTLITASGQIQQLSPTFQKWYGIYDLPYQENPRDTFYSQWGIYSEALAFVGLLFVLFRAKRRSDVSLS